MTDSTRNVRTTPLYDKHLALGAKMAPFAGWNMPINYPSGIINEHLHTRTKVALFDICHMGELRFAGAGVAAALDKALARGVADQKTGFCRYNFLLNDSGGVIDDLIVYRMDEEDFFIVVNAGNIEIDFATLSARMPENIVRENLSDSIGKLDLQGPLAAEAMTRLGVDKAELPPFFHCRTLQIGDANYIVSRTGYTGELGYEIYGANANIVKLWDELLSNPEVKAAGLGARDTLRLEAGLALYGHELSEEITPLEAGFGKFLKLAENPEREFAGKAGLTRETKRTLVGVKLDSRRAARNGAEVFLPGDKKVGIVTSGAFAPSLNCAVAMVLVDIDNSAIDTILEFDAGGKSHLTGTITSLPFYQEGSLRREI